MVALFAAACLTGCGAHRESFTYKLWHMDEFRHVREPSADAAVAVYYAERRKDYLVAYNSHRDGGDRPRREAYFLGDYQSKLGETKQPRLVSTNRLHLVPVPMSAATNVVPRAEFDRQLTIHSAAGPIGPYALPAYAESDGTVVKTVLTPLAVVGDATCVSLIVGLVALAAYARSGASVNVD